MLRQVALISSSGYLQLVCAYMAASAMASSMVYFLRAVVVATSLRSSASRLAYFAGINSLNSALILGLQLGATAPLIGALGIRGALLVSPALCAVGFAALAMMPVPGMVAGAV
jgi:ATP:ADP antiporter, AAA family